MSDYHVIEDPEAILLKCPDCGKFRDAIAFAPQLPRRLAPDGFVKCTCSPQPYHATPTSSVLGFLQQLARKLDNEAPMFAVNGRTKNLLERYRARYERERHRKQIARRQHRAAFRRRKRGVA